MLGQSKCSLIPLIEDVFDALWIYGTCCTWPLCTRFAHLRPNFSDWPRPWTSSHVGIETKLLIQASRSWFLRVLRFWFRNAEWFFFQEHTLFEGKSKSESALWRKKFHNLLLLSRQRVLSASMKHSFFREICAPLVNVLANTLLTAKFLNGIYNANKEQG